VLVYIVAAGITAAYIFLLCLRAAYKHYWVGNSSIPGAGLGVFARTNLPAGAIWSPEDTELENRLVINL
jgi:hypothetical protein